MPLSSYEVVRRAIRFQTPDRLPVSFGALGLDDIHIVNYNMILPAGETETIDKWQCVWRRSEIANMGYVSGHPLADWRAYDRFCWPDPDDPAYYEGMDERLEGSEGKYIRTWIPILIFERLHFLRGMENLLMDFYTDFERVAELADRIVDFDVRVIRNIAERFPGRFHGFGCTDDWGTQTSTFVDPKMWCEFFQPRYARVFDAAHDAGWDILMHSDGRINEIMDPLIEIGLDAINLQQPLAVGIEEVGKRFAGRICFETVCDVQMTLPHKGEREIREEARMLLENWARPDGGFVLTDYGGYDAIGVSEEKRKVMLDAFLEMDPYR